MLTPIAYGLAIGLDLLVLLIGGRFLIAPRAAAAGYGVPAKPGGDPAYLTIKGLRDSTYALVGLALIVLRHGGTRATAVGIHFTTAVLVLLSAALLFAS
jgi:hypothetical protein